MSMLKTAAEKSLSQIDAPPTENTPQETDKDERPAPLVEIISKEVPVAKKSPQKTAKKKTGKVVEVTLTLEQMMTKKTLR